MSMSSPDAPTPAKRPQRNETLTPEDIEIEDNEEEGSRGRNALRRPVRNTGNTGGSGGVGTGLSA